MLLPLSNFSQLYYLYPLLPSEYLLPKFSTKMCHGHPKYHPCAHTSVSWYYCASAYFDMTTGAVSPCGNPIMNDSQSTKSACPLQYCSFAAKGKRWLCCQCNQGPNTQGWCTQRLTAQQVGIDPYAAGELQMTCDHGCCKKCTSLGKSTLCCVAATFLLTSQTRFRCTCGRECGFVV